MKKKKKTEAASVAPGKVIRERRVLAGWKAVDLARRARINPRTLNAIEMGRIEMPSLRHLCSASEALGISVASLFADRSTDSDDSFLLGDQKGIQTAIFHKSGFQLVSYTPLVRQLFVGKVILKGHAKIDQRTLPVSGRAFAQPLIGKVTVRFDGKDHLVREGSYVFLDGAFPHSYHNPGQRDCSFLLVTSPSFMVKE
jgi:transcriptional regulator with XRE-family HTH domain